MWSQRAAPALARSIASAIIGGVSLELDRREASMPGRKAQGFGWSSAVFCFPLKETTLSLSFLQSQSLSFPRERESLVVHDSPIITVELRSRPRQYLSESIALDRWMTLSPPSRPLFL